MVFAKGKFSILILSRGHGWGHALPDIAIAKYLSGVASDLSIQFASYAAGAEVYRKHLCNVIDLELSANPPLWDLLVKFSQTLKAVRPDLVVAHEDATAIPAAAALGIPSIFVTDFFLDPSNLLTQALRYADEVVFLAQPGLYTEPPFLRKKIEYAGRAVRKFDYTIADRQRARAELDIPKDATVVLVQPGAWSESQLPLGPLLRATWDLLPCSPKRLVWLAGMDTQRLTSSFRDFPESLVLKEDLRLDRLMAASNILIAKANRMTVYEAAAIGLPSISISASLNWPDDVAVANVESNTLVLRDIVTPESLAALIVEKLRTKPRPAAELSGGIEATARRIMYHVERIKQERI